MVSFKSRSHQSEIMDEPGIPDKLLHKNLGELDIMNRYIGGHAISLDGIKRLMTNRQKEYHIVDLGCGSGDVLRFIARWARTHQYRVKLTGVDINADAINYLYIQSKEYPEITGIVSDYIDYIENCEQIDIVHCGLFCHHLDDMKLMRLFNFLKTCSSKGVVINDLQRNPVAYYSVWFLTRLLNGTTLAKHDGPVSVLRAFKRSELEWLIQNAGLSDFSIQWKWAFRYLVVVKTGK